MGLLTKIGDIIKGGAQIVSSAGVGGPIGDIATGITAATQGSVDPFLRRQQLAGQRLGGGKLIKAGQSTLGIAPGQPGQRQFQPVSQLQQPQPTGGVPPGFGQDTGRIPGNGGLLDILTGRRDIPFVPDPADVRQLGRGENPFAQMQANGLTRDVNQLLGSNQIVMQPGQKVINTAPKGWVVVDMPDGTKKAVLKSVAKKLGLWKKRKKPPISASDWNKLKRADAVKKKAKRIGKKAGFKVTKK